MKNTNTTLDTLTKGVRYTDIAFSRRSEAEILASGMQVHWSFAGWSRGDGTGHEGYRVEDYFSPDGTYLGPDKHGIEPLFELCPRINTRPNGKWSDW